MVEKFENNLFFSIDDALKFIKRSNSNNNEEI